MPEGRLRSRISAVLLAAAAAGAAIVLARLGWPGDLYRGSDFEALRDATPLAIVPLAVSAPLWLVGQVLAVALGLGALRSRVLLSAPTRDGVLLAGLALAYQPLWLAFATGSIHPFLFGALAGSTALVVSRRPLAGGALAGFLAMRPLAYAILLPAFVLGTRDRRRTVVLGMLVTGILSAALAYAAGLALPLHEDATVWSLDRALGLQPAGLLPATVALIAIGVFALWWRRSRPTFEIAAGAGACVSLLVAYRAETTSQLALLLAVAAIIELRAHVMQGRRIAGLVVLALAAGVAPWAIFVGTVRGLPNLGALVPALVFGLLLTSDRFSRRSIERPARDREGFQLIG